MATKARTRGSSLVGCQPIATCDGAMPSTGRNAMPGTPAKRSAADAGTSPTAPEWRIASKRPSSEEIVAA